MKTITGLFRPGEFGPGDQTFKPETILTAQPSAGAIQQEIILIAAR